MARKRGLEHGDVLEAGFAVLDRDGVEGVSLRAVADLLQVQPPSLYSHVAGLGGLLDDLAIAATADFGDTLRDAAVGVAGDDAIRAFGTAYRDWAFAHPGRYALTLRTVARPERKAAGMGAVETMDRILAHYSLGERETRWAARSLRASLHGFVTLRAADALGRSDHEASFDAMLDLFLDGLHNRAIVTS
ncbi:MAG: TetR/AcrR family transcriptional regulator [Acidimicrobiales bacterium]|jgi:AcrR family transcriptional regulator